MEHQCNKVSEITDLQVSFKYTKEIMDEMKLDIKTILEKFNKIDETFATKKELEETRKNIEKIDGKFWYGVLALLALLLACLSFFLSQFFQK